MHFTVKFQTTVRPVYCGHALYRTPGHLVIADSFLWNWPNNGQTLIEKPLCSKHVYSGHLL